MSDGDMTLSIVVKPKMVSHEMTDVSTPDNKYFSLPEIVLDSAGIDSVYDFLGHIRVSFCQQSRWSSWQENPTSVIVSADGEPSQQQARGQGHRRSDEQYQSNSECAVTGVTRRHSKVGAAIDRIIFVCYAHPLSRHYCLGCRTLR
ncbi:hypothetical protein PoB_003453800 [Plakobranchus ocellatus]|uniref:Uncharacterized protein n=1 Tax=Plakobranchus ocellatus TaxID=259542 RepID=A0AAV4AL49_9GAST|nr:hypothetical protein PoB_003453800 [Plakobranchus ocellatus]